MDAAVRQLLIKLLASWNDWPERRTWYLAEYIPHVISTDRRPGATSRNGSTSDLFTSTSISRNGRRSDTPSSNRQARRRADR